MPMPNCTWSVARLLAWNKEYYGADPFALVSKFNFECKRKKRGAFQPPSRRAARSRPLATSPRRPTTARASDNSVGVKGATPVVDSRLIADRCTGQLPVPDCSWSLAAIIEWDKRYYGAGAAAHTHKYNIDCVAKKEGPYVLPVTSHGVKMVTPERLIRRPVQSATYLPTARSPFTEAAIGPAAPAAVAPVQIGLPGDRCGPTAIPVSQGVWVCHRPDGSVYYVQPATKKQLEHSNSLSIDYAIQYFR